MNALMNQLLNKQAEMEKNIFEISIRERQYKDTIDELAKVPLQDNSDINRYELLLRELEIENQTLKDKLQAVENNIGSFISDMSELIKNEENNKEPCEFSKKIYTEDNK